ncbi:low molecular weight phosphatase family protein [Microcella alkalica]|uniref:arsenate-mycothiol transferase ArsC n=1 Tax=Microcella alkalica TaxID=355930 RepID=UPI00145DCAE4|nr:arsenate reductase ArsC [Microcella alkalica]
MSESLPVPDVARRISARLAARYAGMVGPETVQAVVDDSYRRLAATATITQFLPSLTARFAADRLAAIARAEGVASAATPSVLFVCVENSGRSQLAGAILRALAGDRVTVMTAGSEPGAGIASGVAEVLDEVGIPVLAEYPKPLTDDLVRGADHVITMGCGDACPVLPGRRYEDWAIADPVPGGIEGMRAARDAITARVEGLLAQLRTGSVA